MWSMRQNRLVRHKLVSLFRSIVAAIFNSIQQTQQTPLFIWLATTHLVPERRVPQGPLGHKVIRDRRVTRVHKAIRGHKVIQVQELPDLKVTQDHRGAQDLKEILEYRETPVHKEIPALRETPVPGAQVPLDRRAPRATPE